MAALGSESLPLDIRYQQAIRKPIFTEPGELYDLSQDIGEENDVSAAHPDIVKKMQGMIDEATKK